VPEALAGRVELAADGRALIYTYDTRAERTGITALLTDLQKAGLQLADLTTHQSSLEDIFVDLVKETA
jgi:ABC-2 type transport system ATP-binding protein